MLTIAKVPLDILKRPFCWAISIEHCVPLWDKTQGNPTPRVNITRRYQITN
jgi:hypothetical protein